MRLECGFRSLVLTAVTVLAAAAAEPGPRLSNGSFEADTYAAAPGYARQNGGTIAGWTASGSCGLNPVWRDPARRSGPDAPFLDNGRVPDGRQVAFVQGPGALRQTVTGLRPGRRYRVLYRENARVQRRGEHWPVARVTLAGQVLVSPHEVTPVAGAEQTEVPFYRIESAWFEPAGDGACELAVEAVQASATTTLLIDDVRIEEAPAP